MTESNLVSAIFNNIEIKMRKSLEFQPNLIPKLFVRLVFLLKNP